jgi:hypothetical protein
VNSMEETRLAEDLRLLAASPPDPPDLGQIERRGARRRQRGHAIRGLAALAGLVVATATGLTVAGSGPGPRPGPPTETVGYVTQRIRAALNLSGGGVKTTETQPTSVGPLSYWTDLRTGDSMLSQGRGAARTTYWMEQYFDRQHQVLHSTQTHVNYGPRTWWTDAMQAHQPPGGSVGFMGAGQSSMVTPQDIAMLLKHVATIVGHPYVNGHRTVELSIRFGGISKSLVWADTSTYQVVRVVQYLPLGAREQPQVLNYTWARRSAALVQQVDHPHIPAGYRQVPPGG